MTYREMEPSIQAMTISEFCIELGKLHLTQTKQAIAILWFLDQKAQGAGASSGELARHIRESGLGNPNSTLLGQAIQKTKQALKTGRKFKLKPTEREPVSRWVSTICKPEPAPVDQETGYLPKAVWENTRSYIEKIAIQVNGCYEHRYFDGASVLVRRLVETLLIECYEHLKIEHKIKKADGNYPMLSEIIIGAVDNHHLSLGRETKSVLKEIKTVGDRSAHNRRYNAVKADLQKLQSGVRLVVDELLHLATLK